jgi:hypothetical protein
MFQEGGFAEGAVAEAIALGGWGWGISLQARHDLRIELHGRLSGKGGKRLLLGVSALLALGKRMRPASRRRPM